MIIDKLLAILESKGALIGFFGGLLKVMQDARLGLFKWVKATTELIASTGVGVIMFEWINESSSLSGWKVNFLTLLFSLNAFLLVKVFTDPEVLKAIIGTWIKKIPEINKENDTKNTENN